jgi:hypothetical protein
MKKTLSYVYAVFCLALGAEGQSFINMDFEQAGNNTIASNAFFVNWSIAANGWTHPDGGDTVFVDHISPQTNITQYYFLVDSLSAQLQPLAGEFSFAFSSGYYSSVNQSLGFVNAYIAQNGVVPNTALSFSLLATGNFSVLLNATVIPMFNVAGNLYVGDVSAFQGQFVTLRIRNNANVPQTPVEIDNLQFLSTPVPEPSTLALLGCGLGALLVAARRRATRV